MKNVLLMIQNLSNGGAEKAISLLANALKEEFNVTLVAFDNRIKDYIPNVNIIDLKIPHSKNILKQFINLLTRVRKVKKIKKELNIDCSISFLQGPNLVNCFSKCNDKIIISIRNIESKIAGGYLYKRLNQITLSRADKIVSVSKAVECDLKNFYKVKEEKLETIYNMLDIEDIEKKKNDEIEEKSIFDNDEIKIINIGRLNLQKGQWHLIKAFKIVKEKFPKAKLIILGRGEFEKDYKLLIDKLSLNENVFFLDYKSNPYKYLNKSDIFVSTSCYEGMPNVLLEAIACNLPIIATDCLGGTREILGYEDNINNPVNKITECDYGILIPRLNEEVDFSTKISKEDQLLGEEIINFINYTQKRTYYKEVYNKRKYDFSNYNLVNKWIDLIK